MLIYLERGVNAYLFTKYLLHSFIFPECISQVTERPEDMTLLTWDHIG